VVSRGATPRKLCTFPREPSQEFEIIFEYWRDLRNSVRAILCRTDQKPDSEVDGWYRSKNLLMFWNPGTHRTKWKASWATQLDVLSSWNRFPSGKVYHIRMLLSKAEWADPQMFDARTRQKKLISVNNVDFLRKEAKKTSIYHRGSLFWKK